MKFIFLSFSPVLLTWNCFLLEQVDLSNAVVLEEWFLFNKRSIYRHDTDKHTVTCVDGTILLSPTPWDKNEKKFKEKDKCRSCWKSEVIFIVIHQFIVCFFFFYLGRPVFCPCSFHSGTSLCVAHAGKLPVEECLCILAAEWLSAWLCVPLICVSLTHCHHRPSAQTPPTSSLMWSIWDVVCVWSIFIRTHYKFFHVTLHFKVK